MAKRKTGVQMDDGGEGQQQQGKFSNIPYHFLGKYHYFLFSDGLQSVKHQVKLITLVHISLSLKALPAIF